ncbi:hypothetical protein Q8A67_014656 [Cirrhinus molitorella]|uniref:Uncharacterized protein n=1 Tax=Cirrhinus molitorella TaxID=172907 RepID=A0AA88PM05_9TELE|nr:hypothetical protein Q8A67_014656 [Cirrhinus molitorella]
MRPSEQAEDHRLAPADIVEHNRISLSKCDTQASPDGASTSQLVSRFVKYLLRMMVHEEYMRTVEQCFTALLLCEPLPGRTAAHSADKVFPGMPGMKRTCNESTETAPQGMVGWWRSACKPTSAVKQKGLCYICLPFHSICRLYASHFEYETLRTVTLQ